MSAENPCKYSMCKQESKCIPISSYSYNCECNSMWTGRYCSIPSLLNPCYSSPCKRNATCLLDQKLGTYKCICAEGIFL